MQTNSKPLMFVVAVLVIGDGIFSILLSLCFTVSVLFSGSFEKFGYLPKYDSMVTWLSLTKPYIVLR